LNDDKIKAVISSKIDISEIKKDNLKHSINNALNKIKPDNPENI